MGKRLNEIETTTHVANIVQHGEEIILPELMSIDDAIDTLQRRRDYMNESVEISRAYDAFPWDGANALANVLTERFGWVAGETIPGGFFTPDQEPQTIEVETAPGVTRGIPWGRFSIPNVRGYIECDVQRKENRFCFAIEASVSRLDEQFIRKLFDDVQNELNRNSIYAGKAIKIRFRNDNGKALPMPEPKFLRTNLTRDDLIYSQDVQDAIETNLFTPIERVQDCIANDIPVKRGVLLGGPYGTGKTLAATVAARVAVDNNVTFIYVPRADELADAIKFAQQYQTTACVVFCEDIDRAMSGERSVKMDDILNILDGIDTKNGNVITVLTTNHLENINPAMLRPGRLDAVINVSAPDAKAAEALVRLYGQNAIAADEDLTAAGKLLEGNIPAVIAEVVKRAKLVQLRLQEPGTKVERVTGAAVAEAARTMDNQIQLLKDQSKPKDKEPTIDDMMATVLSKAMNGTKERIEAIHNQVC